MCGSYLKMTVIVNFISDLLSNYRSKCFTFWVILQKQMEQFDWLVQKSSVTERCRVNDCYFFVAEIVFFTLICLQL